MFSWIAKHVIPHHGNDHRPHLLRGETSRYIALILIVIEVIFFASLFTKTAGLGMTAAVVPGVLGELTNGERSKESLGTLAFNPVLDEAARLKAEDMASKGYFSHTSPQGLTPWYWLDKVGYEFEYAGENLAINFSDSEDVTEAWMDSPTHRANIEKANYTEVGTGIASGIYEGSETVFVVQIYAKPVKAAKPSIDVKTTQIASVETAVAASSNERVLGASIDGGVENAKDESEPAPGAAPTFIERAQASPRNTANLLFFIIGAIVVATFMVTIIVQFVRGKLNHYDLLTNTIMIMVLIGAFYLGNLVFSRDDVETSFTSFDSSRSVR